ncbi:NTP transferase domain-containing protein [Candidatus Pelagibacter sp.]|nr:NTP transferase domain-containing protein [Candidatus Pelagibacter sp.]
MQLIILASGRGSRLNKLTSYRPKCLVKIKNKTILDRLSKNFLKFNETIIVAGYKSEMIRNEISKVKKIINKKYMSTNMVHSLFCARKYIKNDIIVSYGDIVFDDKIINKMIGFNCSHIPLNKKWLSLWKKRMNEKKINNDAENILIKKNKVISIGGKITNIRPKLQFMGLIKLRYRDFKKLYKYYINLKNSKIDMTNFLNIALKDKIFNLNYFETSRYWFEVDNIKDKNITEKYL